MTVRHAVAGSPIGELTLVAEGDAITGLYFPRQRYMPDRATFGPRVEAGRGSTGFADAQRQLGEYFAGERTAFDLRLDPRGDDFQQQVWKLLGDIPYGQTMTYAKLAGQLGDVTLARDVGAAVGRNPLSILVPCHRVIGRDGRLTGYAGGLDRKRFLLELEEPAERKAARLF